MYDLNEGHIIEFINSLKRIYICDEKFTSVGDLLENIRKSVELKGLEKNSLLLKKKIKDYQENIRMKIIAYQKYIDFNRSYLNIIDEKFMKINFSDITNYVNFKLIKKYLENLMGIMEANILFSHENIALLNKIYLSINDYKNTYAMDIHVEDMKRSEMMSRSQIVQEINRLSNFFENFRMKREEDDFIDEISDNETKRLILLYEILYIMENLKIFNIVPVNNF